MTEPEHLFRAEALQELNGRRGPGAVLHLTTPWVPWLYRAALFLTGAGIAAGYAVRVDRDVAGPARLGPAGRSFVAVLPASDPSELGTSDAVRVEFDGPSGTVRLPATVRTAGPATAEDLRRSGLTPGPGPGPALLVTGSITARDVPAPNVAGSARLVVAAPSERFLSVLVRGFGGA